MEYLYTIITMARIIDDLSRKNGKDLDLGKEKEIKTLKEKNRSLQDKHDSVKVLHESLRTYADELERAIGDDKGGKKTMEELIKARVEVRKLELEGSSMKTELAEMIQKYTVILNKKEDYKKRCERQEKEMKVMKEKMNEEVEEIKDRLNSEAVDCSRWRKQYYDLSERSEVSERLIEDHAGEMRKVKDKHEREMKEINDCYHLEVEGKNIELRDVQRNLEDLRQNFDYQKKLNERAQDTWEYELSKSRREVKIYQEKEIEERQDKMAMQKEYYDMKDNLKVQEAAVILLIKKNEELMNKYNELRDELRNEREEEVRNTPMAKQEEPGPHKEGEGVKEESTLLESTTGAVLGDSEADNETSTAQERTDQKRSRKELIPKPRRKDQEMSSSEESDYSNRSRYSKHRPNDRVKEVEERYERKLEEQNRKHWEEIELLIS